MRRVDLLDVEADRGRRHARARQRLRDRGGQRIGARSARDEQGAGGERESGNERGADHRAGV